MKRALVLTAFVALAASGCGYNKIQSLDEQVNGYRGQIDAQLQRRADLIPNLVSTVKGYASQELEVFDKVTSARAALSGAIGEDNPEIKSNENFRALQDQLEGTENRIATARMDYNNAVREYNAYIRRFPQVLTAKVIGAHPRDYFEAEEGAQEAPKVEF
jgi:LemA protein